VGVARRLRAACAIAVAAALCGCASTAPARKQAAPPRLAARPSPDSAALALAGRWTPALDGPRADASGRAVWTRDAILLRPEVAAVRARLASGDSAGAWRAALAVPGLEPFAFRQAARAALASGDTARADSGWARLASLESPWAWEGLRERADLAAAGGRLARADSLLASADRDGWADADRASWLVRRARLAVALGDSGRALELGRQLVRRYPSLAPAATGTALVESVLVARGERPGLDDEVAFAEVSAFRGERRAAAARLQRALERSPEDRRWRLALRAGELLRQDRSFAASRPLLDTALRGAGDADDRARVRLERARLDRDAGQDEAARKEFKRALSLVASTPLRATIAWELALELDGDGLGAPARAAYRVVARAGGARGAEASLRVALSFLVEGRRDSARAVLAGAEDDAGRFWRATLRPRSERAAAEAEWRALASRPGYGFYAVAARESLQARGWTGAVARDGCGHREACAPLDRARELAAVGAADDAVAVLLKWAAAAAADARLIEPRDLAASAASEAERAGGDDVAADSALSDVPEPPEAAGLAPALLRASRIAYDAGRIPAAVRLAQRALDASDAAGAWGVAPWLYPPAFDSLYRALPSGIWSEGLTPELARAVAWQESRFDPQARSRSDALGLYQLKLPTAGDVARWLGEPPPTPARLFEPARSIRYGIAYLEWLSGRFDRHPLVAVAAYNSGPGAVPATWRRDLERGGIALFCERLSRAETRDYVRRIMGARAAYRELAPTATREPAPSAE
jgi:soluble lytic murein transglycosylase-like protein/tetratricopeptide (TPR) repeat protein